MVIKINGRLRPSIADAATHFGVTTKTVRTWIADGIIPIPPQEAKGQGFVDIFESEYLTRAEAALRKHREKKLSSEKGQPAV